MVDFSLKKTRNNWKHSKDGSNGDGGGSSAGSPSKGKNKSKPKSPKKSSPYMDMKVSSQYSQLPTINAKERNKVASSMQRRLSVHNANYIPPKLDYSMPLPSMQPATAPTTVNGNESPSMTRDEYRRRSPAQERQVLHDTPRGFLQPQYLRKALANPNFNAKTFVHENLGDASAMEIDKFTSNLTNLSAEVQEEVKRNVNRSYKEILTVNADLSIANSELKNLRESFNELKQVLAQFTDIAQARLQIENQQSSMSSTAPASASTLLPPVRSNTRSAQRRDRTSVLMLEKIWDNELSNLFKNVEGSQKMLHASSSTHILLETEDWLELNFTTLKPLQTIRVYVLNDAVLVASRTRDKHTVVASQYILLKNLTARMEDLSSNRISFKTSNGSTFLFESRTQQECLQLLDIIRHAKDDLREIYYAEEKKSQRLKESYNYLQQQTPGRESTKSPVKSQRRSIGNMTPGRGTNDYHTDQYLLQSITMSMHSRTRSRDMGSTSQTLKQLDDNIEEIDIELSRLKFNKAVDILLDMEQVIGKMAGQMNEEGLILHGLITLKLSQRRESIISKLSQVISTSRELSHLTSAVGCMIKLGHPEDGLDLFLQNQSALIQNLILQIGTLDNSLNYLTQIAVIRFQTIKKTVLNYEKMFGELSQKYSSILVGWCTKEVGEHFGLIDKQLLNNDMLSPACIKSSRKQIDELKSVGLDFVYKLDDFIKRNSTNIH